MPIKHPFFRGRVSSRLKAMGQYHRVQAKFYRLLSSDDISEDSDEFLQYIAALEELYEAAHRQLERDRENSRDSKDNQGNETEV